MKAEINKDGILKIEVQNELEVYALTQWMKENITLNPNSDGVGVINPIAISFDWSLQPRPREG